MQSMMAVSKFLKIKLEEKQLKNKSYSMRAFAQKMGLSPGGLVQIMSGKKKLSVERAHEIAAALKLLKDEKRLFILLTEFEQSKGAERKAAVFEEIKKLSSKRTAELFDLSIDQFKLISEWYGLAILECASTYGKTYDAKEFSRHFGISPNEATLTLERLQRLELLAQTDDGCWERVKDRVLISSQTPSEAIRNYYMSVAKKSSESYNLQYPQERISGAETFTFDADQIEEVRALTYEYLDKIVEISRKGRNKTTTYQALINIFRLNEISKEKI